MPIFRQIIQIMLIVGILILTLWIAFYLFLVLIIGGMAIAAYIGIRRWLTNKGVILSEDHHTATSNVSHVTIIETDYKEVTEKDAGDKSDKI